MKVKQTIFAIALLALAVITPSTMKADGITFTLTPTATTVSPGQGITFNGSVTDGSGDSDDTTVFLNELDINFTAPTGMTLNNDFLSNASIPFSLDPGQSFPATSFFDVFVDLNFNAYGTYSGSATLLGGGDGSAQDTLATKDFQVVVAPAATPEPSSFLLLATGAAGLAGALRRKISR